MTVRRGEDWGSVGPAPPGLVLVSTDREVRRLVTAARRDGREPPPVGLLGGDLCRAVGGRGRRERFDGDRGEAVFGQRFERGAFPVCGGQARFRFDFCDFRRHFPSVPQAATRRKALDPATVEFDIAKKAVPY